MVSDGSSTCEDQSGGGYNGAFVDLHRLRLQLQEILGSIFAFQSPARLPPVLDVSSVNDGPPRVGGAKPPGENGLPGLRALEESIRRDLEVLTKVSTSAIPDAPGSGAYERID